MTVGSRMVDYMSALMSGASSIPGFSSSITHWPRTGRHHGASISHAGHTADDHREFTGLPDDALGRRPAIR